MPSAMKVEMSFGVGRSGRFVAVAVGCAPCLVELCSIPLAPPSETSSVIAAKFDCSILSVHSLVVGSPWNPFCHFQHIV